LKSIRAKCSNAIGKKANEVELLNKHVKKPCNTISAASSLYGLEKLFLLSENTKFRSIIKK
jgi:hypothetical protein